MNRLRIFAIATALIAGSSALASAETPGHDRDRDRGHNGYVYRDGGYYNDHDRDDRGRYVDRDDRSRSNHDNRWRRDDDDRRSSGWWNRGHDRD
ncbi:MAG TPA: hypothetical protein VG649_05050 [Candidatus Angelobacter sp.]|nr:hypothetical protein [Candidatus Angelobacter sp.]